MSRITSIVYRKRTGEYRIARFDDTTEKETVFYPHDLTASEKYWARGHAKTRYETHFEIRWTELF